MFLLTLLLMMPICLLKHSKHNKIQTAFQSGLKRTKVSARLTVNQKTLERVSSTDMLGMKISSDLSWDRHCQSICQKAYSKIGMLTKLKYAGVGVEDLVDIYMLMIRSITEYCSVVFHSSLTLKQRQKLEMIQKICLRVILGDMYVSYEAALEMTGLDTLDSRRQQRCIRFSLRALKFPIGQRLFPVNQSENKKSVRQREKFCVNFARTEDYKTSAVPFCQRLLNEHFKAKQS